MYLKKIETQGFKSFANRAVLEFTPGIMGIVGPNGSGKSNIADAVRWVLGEQSARQLRGSNMQDVIFAGTESRRPMSYAFVSLTIDNSDRSLSVDTDEVTVSRQVFRSGESEYRLNGNVCRLKDIYETFYDSGIGKEGYSIIGQGQIDTVLSNKPEERRLMFDEAAGIVKYRKRRDITLKKLESEQASRERVEDILGELEKQVGPLEKQSEKARQYLKLRDELKEYEVGAFALESDELESKLNEVRTNLETVNADLERASAEEEHLRDQYDALNTENEERDTRLAARQAQMADMRVANENREGRISLLTEQIRSAQANRDLIEERARDYDAAVTRIEKEREGFYTQKNAVDEELDRIDDKISALEEETEALEEEEKDLTFRLEKGNSTIMASLDRKAQITASLAALDAREEQTNERLAALTQEKEAADIQIRELQSDHDAQQETLKLLDEEIAGLSRKLEEDQDGERNLRIVRAEREEEKQRLERELGILRARRENLSNLIERYDGYGGSVKAIMEKKDRFPGICGVVADLITTDKKYETAIETVLGGRIQNIVTETEDAAKSLINYLKTNRLGRATFLPLDAVRGDRGFARPEALGEPGAIGTAASLVSTDGRYVGIVGFLLGQTLVADNMDHALAIARKYSYRLSIVTLEGEYLTPGGVMSGGAYKNNSNLLGRRRELDACEAEEKRKQARLVTIRTELKESAEKLEGMSSRIAETDLRLRRSSLQAAALRAQWEGKKKDLEQLRTRLASLTEEEEKRGRELEDIRTQRESVNQNVSDLDTDSESIRAQMTDLAVRLDKVKEQFREKSAALETLRVEFSNVSQKGDFLLQNVKRCNEEIARTRREKADLLQGNISVETVTREREEEIRQLRLDIETAEAELKRLEQLQREEEALKEERREEQHNYFEAKEAVTQRISLLDREQYRLQTQEQRLEEQIEKQAEYLWTEYEMTPSQARAIRNPEIKNPAEVRRFIAQRKKAIKELGPVYVESIEKYKEVSERYEFLKGQQEDLIKAEKELQDMIRELEKGMREQFREQFALIRQEFSRVFSDLFAGGKGDLILEDPDDVLSSGVIINAQPPGKKLQNMMQLSGGEKALTAIALLFAIQNLKPSPFCLLDEIEAALDEPNVKRFADYLYRLRGSTQFLIITHRRGTMEMADKLYGITMQEKGVSVLVSVNLTDPASREILDEAE
ncbi:MAG: chromosome segregation protein SMC [Lachnospiraceae bacterium]|nr:chromosome segregation protein SMC [Lachnospiraceae bacterium]